MTAQKCRPARLAGRCMRDSKKPSEKPAGFPEGSFLCLRASGKAYALLLPRDGLMYFSSQYLQR
jgi:hypothetical protein